MLLSPIFSVFNFSTLAESFGRLAEQKPRVLGYNLAFFGVFILSFDAVLIRLIDAPVFTLLFWRGLGLFLVCWLAVVLLEKQSLRAALKRLGVIGLMIALVMAASNIFVLMAFTFNSAAETLIIIAAAPMATALMALFTKEKPPMRTLLAALVAFLGIAVIFSEEILGARTTTEPNTMLGRLVAGVSMIFIALSLNLMRIQKAPSYSASVALAGIMAAAFSAFLYQGGIIEIDSTKIFFTLVNALTLPLAFVFYTMSPRFISAPEVSLVLVTQTVLGPIWVWLAIGEQPSLPAWIGGALVIMAVLANSWLSIRESARESTLAPRAASRH